MRRHDDLLTPARFAASQSRAQFAAAIEWGLTAVREPHPVRTEEHVATSRPPRHRVDVVEGSVVRGASRGPAPEVRSAARSDGHAAS